MPFWKIKIICDKKVDKYGDSWNIRYNTKAIICLVYTYIYLNFVLILISNSYNMFIIKIQYIFLGNRCLKYWHKIYRINGTKSHNPHKYIVASVDLCVFVVGMVLKTGRNWNSITCGNSINNSFTYEVARKLLIFSVYHTYSIK